MQGVHEVLIAKVRKTDSPMERAVLIEVLKYEGIDIETQYPVGKYRLDIALPEYKLGLEVDGYEWHTSESQRARDLLRDEILENQGWQIERVPGWFCYRNPDLAALKIMRFVPGIEQYEQFQRAKRRMMQWYAGELINEGRYNEAKRVLLGIVKGEDSITL